MSNEGRDEGCLVVMAEGDAMTTDKKEVDCVEFMAKHTTAHQG